MAFSNSQIAFAPLGNTVTITANVAAPVGVQVPVTAPEYEAGQFRIVNASTNTVFLAVGPTAATAATRAASAATSVVLLPGTVEILRFGKDSYFSGTAAGASTVYITPGQGL